MHFKSSSRCANDVFNVKHGILTENWKVFSVDEVFFPIDTDTVESNIRILSIHTRNLVRTRRYAWICAMLL
jgi:hypothetical protein